MKKHKIERIKFFGKVFKKIRNFFKKLFGTKKLTVDETLSEKRYGTVKRIEDFDVFEGIYFERRGHLNKVKLVGFNINDKSYPDWFWTFVTENQAILNNSKEGFRMITIPQPAVGKSIALGSHNDYILIDENLRLRVISGSALIREYDCFGEHIIAVGNSPVKTKKVEFV